MKAESRPEPRLGTQLVYGFGQLAEGVHNEALGIFLLFYYREVLGLSGTLAGLALLLALLADAVSDPVVGVWSDRVRTRLGRRHPFMYASLLPLGVCYCAVFVPPAGLSGMALFAWLTSALIASRLAMTLFHVPHMALGAELSDDYRVRTRIVSIRMVFSRMGAGLAPLLGLLVFMRPTDRYENGQLNPDAYPPFAVTTAVLMLIPIAVSSLGTRRVARTLAVPAQVAGSLLSGLMRDFAELLRLKNFRVHFFGSTVAFTGWGIMGTSGLHMATYFWHVDTQQLFLWGVAMTAGIFAGLVFWSAAAERLEKRDIFVRGLGVYILCTAPTVLCKTFGLFPPEGTIAYYALYGGLVGFAAHFGIASTMVTGGSMMADIADEDAVRHGARRQGAFFGAVSFAAKAAVGLGAQLAGILLDLAGLQAKADPAEVGADVVQRLGLVLGGTVVVLTGGAMWIYRGYHLGAVEHQALREALAARGDS